ncbi:MAG: ECF-type sigma factor, partial [Rhodothermales bacterium]|nr:ECF-type sigma factor [Rhodothermales bacterium]
MTPASEVTRLLHRWSDGDRAARDLLMEVLYQELRSMARQRMRMERSGHTLGTTGLVHEAYLKLANADQLRWNDRQHFLALLSRIMRHILLDYARARHAARRGGDQDKVTMDEAVLVPDREVEAVLDLEEALSRLENEHPRAGEAIAHSYFGGLTNEEIAEVIGVSRATVERDLRFARAWLARVLDGSR